MKICQKVSDSNPLGTQLGLGAPPHCKAPIDLQIDSWETLWLTSHEWGCPPIMAQSWLRCSEIADKDMFKKKQRKNKKQLFFITITFDKNTTKFRRIWNWIAKKDLKNFRIKIISFGREMVKKQCCYFLII